MTLFERERGNSRSCTVEHTMMRINKVSRVSIHTCRFIHVRLCISCNFIVINMQVTFKVCTIYGEVNKCYPKLMGSKEAWEDKPLCKER